jgi:hypothetical protein
MDDAVVVCSGCHPMGILSPFFRTLDLEAQGDGSSAPRRFAVVHLASTRRKPRP